MKFLILFLLFSFTAHATLYVPGAGGSGAVDSVNGQTGAVVIDLAPKATYGGDTFGAVKSLGTKDAYAFTLKTNDTDRLFINSSGVITVGTDTSSFTLAPTSFGVFKSQLVDTNSYFNVFESFGNFYGSSSSNYYGATYRMSLRPGETFFTYSGDNNVLRADGYVSQPGRVNSWSALKTALSTTNGGAVLDDGIASETVITTAAGVIKKATGFKATQIQALGTDAGTAHNAYGAYIDTVTAGGSDTANVTHGVYLSNNLTATGTGAKVWAIKSDSTADSKFAGKVEVGDLVIDQSPTPSAVTPSTHKLPIILNGVTYYILLTN